MRSLSTAWPHGRTERWASHQPGTCDEVSSLAKPRRPASGSAVECGLRPIAGPGENPLRYVGDRHLIGVDREVFDPFGIQAFCEPRGTCRILLQPFQSQPGHRTIAPRALGTTASKDALT